MSHRSSLSSHQTEHKTATVDNPSRLLALLADEHVREILSATSRHPVSAEELESTCDPSLSTIYRKIDTLVELGILNKQFKVPMEGQHEQEFKSNIDTLEITYTPEDQFTVKIYWRGCNESSLNHQRGANKQ